MNNVLLTPIRLNELELLIQNSVERALKAHSSIITEPTGNSKQWLDLNGLVKYDPERRTKATWYSKISKGEVPYHKRSKKVYFLKSEIDEWLKAGRQKTNSEIETEAHTYLVTNRKGLKNGK